MTKNRFSTILILFLFFAFVYFLFLGKSGFLEQLELNKRIASVRTEVDRLQVENKNLIVKKNLLKNDPSILEMEARKYYLLSENAHVLKFKEPALKTQPEKLLAAGTISFNIFKEESRKEEVPAIALYRIFYIFFSFVAGTWAFIKLV